MTEAGGTDRQQAASKAYIQQMPHCTSKLQSKHRSQQTNTRPIKTAGYTQNSNIPTLSNCAADLQFSERSLHSLKPLYCASWRPVRIGRWRNFGCCGSAMASSYMCKSCPGARARWTSRAASKQVEGVQSAEQALQTSRLTLHLLLEALLPLLLLLLLKLLIHRKLFAAHWAGVVLQ